MTPPRTLDDQRGVFLEHRQRIVVDHRAHVRAETRRVAEHQFIHAPGQQGLHARRDLLLHQQHAQRRTTLTGAVETRVHDVEHELFGERRAVGEHHVEPAGFRDQRADRARSRRHATLDEARGFGGAREHHAGEARIARQRAAHFGAVARHELQRLGRHARLQQQTRGVGRGQRRLFGRFGDHGVAGGQRRGDLARVDSQRKIPRTDAAEHTLAAQPQQVALAGRARQRGLVREIATRARRVVAQEIDRLAHFADGVGQGLAGLAHAARHQRRAVLFEQHRRALEHGRAFLAAAASQSSCARNAAPMAPSTAAASADDHAADLLGGIRRD